MGTEGQAPALNFRTERHPGLTTGSGPLSFLSLRLLLERGTSEGEGPPGGPGMVALRAAPFFGSELLDLSFCRILPSPRHSH